MTQLQDILNPTSLRVAMDQGFIRAQYHPTLPYVIYNYTEKATFEHHWTPETRLCRGLIVDQDTEEVLARPFPKFFNSTEPDAPAFSPSDIVIATDKADGSLGIMYQTPDGPAIATRGSFTSPQALHATALLRTKYPRFVAPEHDTVLFEIIYPENRIVLNYGVQDDLILLGHVRVHDGAILSPRTSQLLSAWPGPVTPELAFASRYDTLSHLFDRPNAEGLVVRNLRTDDMIKIKQPDYVALHRIVTNLSERTVWQHLVDDKPISDLLINLPEEFHPWVQKVALDLVNRRDSAFFTYLRLYQLISRNVLSDKGEVTRKDFALAASKHPESAWALFAFFDRKNILPQLWRRLEPKGNTTRYSQLDNSDSER